MAPNSELSFPCFLWLPDRLSEQGKKFEEKPDSDYVFFDPSVDLKRSDERSLNREGRCGVLSKASSGVSADACDLLSRNQSGGDADVLGSSTLRPES